MGWGLHSLAPARLALRATFGVASPPPCGVCFPRYTGKGRQISRTQAKACGYHADGGERANGAERAGNSLWTANATPAGAETN